MPIVEQQVPLTVMFLKVFIPFCKLTNQYESNMLNKFTQRTQDEFMPNCT